MTENKRYSFNWERGHPNFWDNHCDLADCYLTCEDVVDRLNELNDENKRLHKVIEENEKVIQSIYDELIKLRHIKENLRKIRNQWNWLIGSIDYD